jgi:hypothetical protein
MKLIKLIAFAGVMAMSMNVLAEGGGDRTFEKMLSANTQAMEQYAASQGKPAPVVKDYEYGMKLDVVKVVSVVQIPKTQKRHSKVPFLFSTECRLRDQPANPDC